MKKSRIGSRRRQSETPVLRHLPLVDILVDTQTELQELVVASVYCLSHSFLISRNSSSDRQTVAQASIASGIASSRAR